MKVSGVKNRNSVVLFGIYFALSTEINQVHKELLDRGAQVANMHVELPKESCQHFSSIFDHWRFINCSMSIADKIREFFFHYKVAFRLRIDFYRLKKQCKHARGIKIQFGCGDRPRKGWLNTDLVPRRHSAVYALDAKKRMPFNNGTATFIFFEQLIEHLTKKEGIAFLKECYRILETGGVIRMAWPELSNIVHAYLHSDPRIWDTGNPESETLGDKVNDCFYLFGHKYIYDFHTLKLTMERIGYVNFQQIERGKSSYPELQNIEQRPGSIAVIEAQKPLRS